MIAKGTAVRQKVQAIEGVIDNARLDTDTGLINYHVTFKTSEGPSARWFAENELDVVEGDKQTISKSDVGKMPESITKGAKS